jgi:hypothetical protein
MADNSTSIDTAEVLAIDAAIAASTGAGDFGLTENGFFPKPMARLLAEKLALARELFGDDLDLTSGSTIRKLLEISALEDARQWAALASAFDNSYVSTAIGDALSRLGEELGLSRPFLEATGAVTLLLAGDLPQGQDELTIARGSRLLTEGGHHVATDEAVTLSPSNPERELAVTAFYPGPQHNLDPAVEVDGGFPQRIARFNFDDPALQGLLAANQAAGVELVQVIHGQPLTGGELRWPDERYRRLLLQAPRSVWTIDAIRVATSLVPGVRQVQIHDEWGGLDINQSIFGNFNFIERVFSSEREVASPYYFTVLVAPTPGAFWPGPHGLQVAVSSAIEDLRPIGIFPRIELADEVGIGVDAKLVVKGLPLPSGSRETINGSVAAQELKARLLNRIREYVDNIPFGEPVRAARINQALLSEPGIQDVLELALLRYPAGFETLQFDMPVDASELETFDCGRNVELRATEVPVFVDDPRGLSIV